MTKESIFLRTWKDEMKELIRIHFPGAKNKKVEAYLDEVIRNNMKNPRAMLINNYKNKQINSDVLTIIDMIEEHNLIIGGAGCLFVQHSERLSILIPYIFDLQEKRNYHKKERKKYPKYSALWLREDIIQNNTKTKVNMLYGAIGYKRFILHNRFIAESVTSCGRQIICTAVMCFENFLGGGIKFNEPSEIFHFIRMVVKDKSERYPTLDCEVFGFTERQIEKKIEERILSLCEFDTNNDFLISLFHTIKHLSLSEKVLLYYKNNLFEFFRVPFISEKLKYIMDNIDELLLPDINQLPSELVNVFNELYHFVKTFVLYEHPIFDRVRKSMYTDKEEVLYVDTDSNFLKMNKWIMFVENEIMHHKLHTSYDKFKIIASNVLTIILSDVIDANLQDLAKYMHTTPEYAKKLNMKNEFFLEKIVFTPAKKRYISNALVQEGVILNNGEGVPEIKGFEFKKSTTNNFVRDYLTNICLNHILKVDDIDVENIYELMMKLKEDIRISMKNGESTFYKQAEVQTIDHYKQPYSHQGTTSVLLWNCLMPDYALELPTDVNIVPIIDIGGKRKKNGEFENKKNIEWFREKYPKEFERINKKIYQNPNPLIANMSLKSIAKPKNNNIELPEWFSDLVNADKVVQDTLGLFHSIAESLGLKLLHTTSNTKFLSNMVDL